MEALVQDRVRPRQVRYQAALRPDIQSSSLYRGSLQLARVAFPAKMLAELCQNPTHDPRIRGCLSACPESISHALRVASETP
jgi:hypothetical protein